MVYVLPWMAGGTRRQWLTIGACPSPPWALGHMVAEVDRRLKGAEAYHATNASPDRRRLVMREMTQDAL
jgi:hypothetical protein